DRRPPRRLGRLCRQGVGALRAYVQPQGRRRGARRRRRAHAGARPPARPSGAGGQDPMRQPALPAEWSRLALVLGGEGMQSGLHFGLNLALMALLPAQEYVAFAFTLVLGGVGLVYMRSLAAMPASTYIGRARSEAAANFYEGAFGAAALAVSLAMAAAAGAILSNWSASAAVSGAVTIGDAVFAATGIAVSAAALWLDADRLQGALAALAVANVAGIVAIALAC